MWLKIMGFNGAKLNLMFHNFMLTTIIENNFDFMPH